MLFSFYLFRSFKNSDANDKDEIILENAKKEVSKIHFESKNILDKDIQSKKNKLEKELEKEISEMMQEVMEAEKKKNEEKDGENSNKFEDLLLEEQKAEKENDCKESN